MNNDELEANGYELCEFGGDCDFCEQEVPEGELFFHSTNYETATEGDYYCRACAVKEIQQPEIDPGEPL